MLAPDETWRDEFAQKVVAAEEELKANPARSDSSIARITRLSKATIYRTRAKMEANGVIKNIPMHERARSDHRAPSRRSLEGGKLDGPRIHVPNDMSMTDLIRSGIKLEDNGEKPENAAYIIGIGTASYRQAKQIVLLADRNDLTTAEKEATLKAIQILTEERRTREAYALVRELAVRVWGGGKQAHNEKTTQRIINEFMNAISVILVACDKGKELTIPQLSAEDAIAVILQLKEAAQALKQLRSNLKRRIR